MLHRAILLCLLTPLLCAAAPPAQKLDLKDGDRILLIGNTFFERDLYHNHFETLVTLLHPDKQLHFRNLGWSGDTVWVNARIGSSPASNPQTLAKTVLDLKPNVIFLAYGMNESFDGEAGLPRFIEGYNALLDALAPTNAKFVLVSPNYHEDMGRPLPDPAAHNQSLKLYTQAIQKLAEKRGALFIDLFTPFERLGIHKVPLFTENGIHLNSSGYAIAARHMAEPLGFLNTRASIEIDAKTAQLKSKGIEVEKLSVTPLVEFTVLGLPTNMSVRITGLPPGNWTLRSGKPLAVTDTPSLADGIPLPFPLLSEPYEKLRSVIKEKNILFFDQYRPQNDMYLFHGRKHEQGRNAREMPMFTRFIETKEAEIAKLKKPQPIKYTLERDEK